MPSSLNLDYYYGGEAEQYSFYRIPKALFTDSHYETMTMEARVLYGLLLESIGLIERKKQGQGKPTRIYVKNFILPSELGQTPSETSQNGKSALPSAGSQDFPKINANKTERNKTEQSNTELSIPPSPPAPPVRRRSERRDRIERIDAYREIIRENIDYDILLHDRPMDAEQIDGYVELMLEVCCSTRDTIRICKDELPVEVVKSRFLKLTREHIEYVMECVSRSATKIGNIKAYLLAALYNATVTIQQYYTTLVHHDMAHGFAC